MRRPARILNAFTLAALLVGFAFASARAETGTFTCAVKEGVEVQRDGLLRRSEWGLWVIKSAPELVFEVGPNILRHYGNPMRMTVIQQATPTLDFVAAYLSAGERITWSRIVRIRTKLPGMPLTFMMDDTIFTGTCTWQPDREAPTQ